MSSPSAKRGYAEVFTDLTGKVVGYLGMPRNRDGGACRRVTVDAVVGPFPPEYAAMGLQMP